ncbi:MAG: carboxylesterase family protein, partial [Actinomycetota bacterium]|nr:carboxylesterase family protein [Actinomycetota bacterium]
MTSETWVTDEPARRSGAPDAPVVPTASGRVRGVWRTTPDGSRSAAFLGLPFAEPPVGGLRFAAPQSKAAWEGVLDCTAYGSTAQRGGDPATQGIPEPSIPGEATLNVNVFTPSPTAAMPSMPSMPVMVWIHGGGFTAGSPASPWYDGRAFNRDGVVTVTISYRLGFDGFGWVPGTPHNRGVLDWLLALEWVRANIAGFGGDPARVTIAGQSAGGGAVLTLLGMPRAQHLFSSALCISGATADVSPARAEAYAHRLAATAGVEATLEGFRSVSEEQLLAAQQKLARGRGRRDPFAGVRVVLDEGLPLGPMVDGDLVPDKAIGSIADGVG